MVWVHGLSVEGFGFRWVHVEGVQFFDFLCYFGWCRLVRIWGLAFFGSQGGRTQTSSSNP